MPAIINVELDPEKIYDTGKKLLQDIYAIKTARAAKNDKDKIEGFERGIKELSITSIEIITFFESSTKLQNELIDDPTGLAEKLQASATAALREPLRKYVDERSSQEQRHSLQQQVNKWVHMPPEALQRELELTELLTSGANKVKIDGKSIKPDQYLKKLAKETTTPLIAEYGNVGRPRSETPEIHFKLIGKAYSSEPVKSLLIMAATETNVPEKEKLCELAIDEFIVTYGILQMQLLLKEWQDNVTLIGKLIAELDKSTREKVVHQFMLDHPDVYEKFKKLYNDLQLEIPKITLPLSATGNRDAIVWEEWRLMALIVQFMQHVRQHADFVSESITKAKINS
ncbi:MAG: hypothetical protein WCE82_10620 [Halobacteriota archaeon]